MSRVEQALCEMADCLPEPADADRARHVLADLAAEAPVFADLLASEQPCTTLLAAIAGASPFLSGLIRRDPVFAAHCLTAPAGRVLAEIVDDVNKEVAATDNEAEAMRILRRGRGRGALLIAMADIGGAWDSLEAAAGLSHLAESLVRAAMRFLLQRRVASGELLPPDPARPEIGCGMTILAMGKLGAGELNYSSDIDLIVFYDPETAPLAPGKDAGKIFIAVTRALVKLMQERTGEGYVFRTDLRLRPDPGATQVAVSIGAAAQYYLSIGQNWERAAMIRARPIAGDIALGEAFLQELRPFIWRKYLDFAAIKDVHAMKRQIHAHKGHDRIAVLGHNLKLGRGGIREIEFFVQTQQLIAGGRQPELRVIKTLDALSALTRAGWIEPEAEAGLEAAYRFLRRIEHRIQMQNDEQTHLMPKDEAGLARLAAFCGFHTPETFTAELVKHLETVQTHYAALFEETPELATEQGNLVFVGGEDDPETLQTLTDMGFKDAAGVSRMVRSWHAGRYAAVRSEKARERLTEIVPVLLEAFSRTAEPGVAFLAFDRFLSRLPGGVQLFSLLSAQPDLLRLLADVMGTSPRLAALLSRRPRTLEAVLDPSFFDPLPGEAVYRAELGVLLQRAAGFEELLDILRVYAEEQKFRIGVRLLSGTADAAEAGAAYSALAGACIDRLLQPIAQDMAVRHGRIKGASVAVVAFGKMGGQEMAATSDLDLMLIYQVPDDLAFSDGKSPMSVSQYFARYTKRMISALTVSTAEGALYEVDMRLRPSGSKGPLATSLDSFDAYQADSAWIWEKMALTRARVVAGPETLRRRIANLIRKDLTQPRRQADVAHGVLDMRNRIAAEKGSVSPWDLKQVRGGIVDVEFITQYLQLVHAHDHPEILSTNTAEALTALAERGLVPDALAPVLMRAVYLYANVAQVLRLCLDGSFDPDAAPEGLKALLIRTASAPSLQVLEAELRETQSAVLAAFNRILGVAEPD